MERTPPQFEKDTYMRNFKLVKFALGLYFEQHITGLENIPDGASLLAINHLKFADSLLVASAYTQYTGQPLRVAAQKEYFEGKGIRMKNNKRILGEPVRRLVTNSHMISADREAGAAGLRQLRTDLTEVFQRGESAGVHPEATRSENGMVNKFYSSAVSIAMENGVDIVPVGINYFEPNSLHPLGVQIAFGVPTTAEYYAHGMMMALPRGRRVESVNNTLEKHVAQLAGMERSHEYMLDIRKRLQEAARSGMDTSEQ